MRRAEIQRAKFKERKWRVHLSAGRWDWKGTAMTDSLFRAAIIQLEWLACGTTRFLSRNPTSRHEDLADFMADQ